MANDSQTSWRRHEVSTPSLFSQTLHETPRVFVSRILTVCRLSHPLLICLHSRIQSKTSSKWIPDTRSGGDRKVLAPDSQHPNESELFVATSRLVRNHVVESTPFLQLTFSKALDLIGLLLMMYSTGNENNFALVMVRTVFAEWCLCLTWNERHGVCSDNVCE